MQRSVPQACPGCLVMVNVSGRGVSVENNRNTSDTAALRFILAVTPPSP